MANDEDSIDDKLEDATAPAPAPAKDDAPGEGGARKDEAAADKARALSDRVRRKIKNVSSKNKRWIN